MKKKSVTELCTPTMDLASATHKIADLEAKVKRLERIALRSDAFIKWMYFRGTEYDFSGPDGEDQKPDTYYPDFSYK